MESKLPEPISKLYTKRSEENSASGKKMKLLILDENYPHSENLVGDVFVHVRAKEYAKFHEVQAFSYFHKPAQLIYEGIPLQMFDNVDSLVEAIRKYDPDKIIIHFYQSWMLDRVVKVFNIPIIIWVHGYEAQGWYRRLFNFAWYAPVLVNFVIRNTKQQYQFRRLIKYANKTPRVKFVFVSNWIKEVAENDTLSRVKNYDIIANPIDIDLFKGQDKEADLRKKILLFRSFNSRKYANDISVKAIQLLSQRNSFKDFSFTIIGKGDFFEKLLAPLRKFSNISIKKGALLREEIPGLHKKHGIFLCPTRQDTHGVSMCEAMASGMVVIASDNSAIPEFVQHNVSGILTNNKPKQIADALEELLNHPEKFKEISSNAPLSVKQSCGIHNILKKELSIIES